ncbi:hypothetical protein GCM10010191_82880 [Actinomadura vinacea]|uniref:Uncharacterized protein n=2 Tax=Actinomadura vinacea TaxID=115336 RepID=A0ABP5XD03_9ACTN
MSDEAVPAPVPPGPGPRPRQAAVREPTGDGRVDEALARLDELDAAPVSAHVEVFEDVHRRLQELLASAGQDDPGVPGPPAGGAPPWRGAG